MSDDQTTATQQPAPRRERMSYADRKRARFQQRVDKWEERLEGPPPPRHLHRAIITILMMISMLGLLWLLTFGMPSS